MFNRLNLLQNYNFFFNCANFICIYAIFFVSLRQI